MTTAQILFEQYKVLPKRVQQQYKKLIDEAEKPIKLPLVEADNEEDEEEDSDTIRISLPALRESIELVKQIRAGTAKTISVEELLASLAEDDESDD